MSAVIPWLYWLTGITIGGYLLLFAFSAMRERAPRAALVSIVSLAIVIAIYWGGYQVWSEESQVWMLVVDLAVFVSALLFFGPLGRTTAIDLRESSDRVDERDVAFAREEYLPGTDKYREYYDRRPELRELDDKTRRLPELLEPGGRYYDEERSWAVSEIFREIEELTTQVDGPVSPDPSSTLSAEEATSRLKEQVLAGGADDVGVARLNQRWVYSQVGRGPEKWGSEIVNRHRFVVAFTIEMAFESVARAPRLAITEETARRYLQGAQLSVKLAREIRQMGYPARAHIAGSNYQIMLPPVAYDAGLGELSRMGYLVSPRLGARLRLGAITTDLPLETDQPTCFGVQQFCKVCKKCAENCPSGSIPHGEREWVRGVYKWPLTVEPCLQYWRAIGTDCGLCMRVCPYSHPQTLVHNIVKTGIKSSSIARQISKWGDDLFYGRRVKYERWTNSQ